VEGDCCWGERNCGIVAPLVGAIIGALFEESAVVPVGERRAVKSWRCVVELSVRKVVREKVGAAERQDELVPAPKVCSRGFAEASFPNRCASESVGPFLLYLTDLPLGIHTYYNLPKAAPLFFKTRIILLISYNLFYTSLLNAIFVRD